MVTAAADPATTRLALAREVTADLAVAPGVVAAFVSGSLTVGLGNATSDVDVHLVRTDGRVGRRQLFAGDVRIDVHDLALDDLRSTLERGRAATLLRDDSRQTPRGPDLALIVQLATGEPVAGVEVLEPLRAALAAAPDQLRRLMVGHWLSLAHTQQEDLAGLLATDPDAAAMTARELLRTAGKAVAASAGDLYPGEKWVWRQLDRSAPPAFPQADFAQLMRGDPLAGAPGRTLADVRGFAQTGLAVAATLGWAGVSLAAWSRWRRGAGPLRRPTELSVRGYRDGVLVTAPAGRRVRLAPDVALIWALCDGVSEAEVVASASALRDQQADYAGLEPTRVLEVLRTLAGSGLVGSA